MRACHSRSHCTSVHDASGAAERVFNFGTTFKGCGIAAAWRLQLYRSCVMWTVVCSHDVPRV